MNHADATLEGILYYPKVHVPNHTEEDDRGHATQNFRSAELPHLDRVNDQRAVLGILRPSLVPLLLRPRKRRHSHYHPKKRVSKPWRLYARGFARTMRPIQPRLPLIPYGRHR